MQINGSSSNNSIKNLLSQAADSQNTPQTASSSLSQQQALQNLKKLDQEVRKHEQAHLSAAGTIATSGAHYEYTTGADGKRYAVGGDVSIDVSEIANDPEATLRKADAIRRAALAPSQPSGQDFSVAEKAEAMANKARLELLQQAQHPGNGSQLDVSA